MATTPVAAIVSGQVTDFDMVREALASEYEILEELGRGGMALVYRAKDRQLEREVAVKVLPFSLAFDAEFVERFQREARTSAQLEHPNIIPIYRVGRAGRVIYFVMKYLRGGALSNILGARRSLTPPEIRRVLLEAGSALGYAAQRGIVHRDIKPDNIMFDEFGQCVLTDFGIAKAATGQKLTGTGMSIGTPHYMSPEQARAQNIDGRSDIYSLGIVAYQCLTGTVPYDGEDSFSIGYKHITEPVPAPQLHSADERRLFEVVRRMLMKDPNDRFQDCEELIAALQGQLTAPAGVFKGRASAVAQLAAGAKEPAGLAPAVAGLGGVAVAPAPRPIRRPCEPADDAHGIAHGRSAQGPDGRRATPRRVADRSLAMRGEGGSAPGSGFSSRRPRRRGGAIYSSSAASPRRRRLPPRQTPSRPAPTGTRCPPVCRATRTPQRSPRTRPWRRPGSATRAPPVPPIPPATPVSSADSEASASPAFRPAPRCSSRIPASPPSPVSHRAATRRDLGAADELLRRHGGREAGRDHRAHPAAHPPAQRPRRPPPRGQRREAIREQRREALASGSFSCEPASTTTPRAASTSARAPPRRRSCRSPTAPPPRPRRRCSGSRSRPTGGPRRRGGSGPRAIRCSSERCTSTCGRSPGSPRRRTAPPSRPGPSGSSRRRRADAVAHAHRRPSAFVAPAPSSWAT